MKLEEYLQDNRFFGLMEDPHISIVSGYLDSLFNIKHGKRRVGQMINRFVVNGEVSGLDRALISELVWYMYKEKWGHLFDYIDAEIVPWTTGSTLTEVKYGKIISDESGGSDTINRNDYISAFDSAAAFADDNKRTQETEYGREDTSTQSGTDTIEVTTRNSQADVLVNYTMGFWTKYGLFDTLISDAAKALCLPVYDLEDYNYES